MGPIRSAAFLGFLLLGSLADTTSGQVLDASPRPLDSPFVRSAAHSPWTDFSAATIEVDDARLREVARQATLYGDVVVTGVPMGPDLEVDVLVHLASAIHPGTRIVLAEPDPSDPSRTVERELEHPDLVVLAGHVVGDPSERVLLAHGAMGTMGHARIDDRTFMISSGKITSNQPILSFDAGGMPEGALELTPLECTLIDDAGLGGAAPPMQLRSALAGGLPCRKVGFAIETDNEYLQNLFNGNSSAASAYTALLLAASTEIFVDQFNVNLELNYLRLWTQTDPWSAGNTSNELYAFQDYWAANMSDVDRDLAHFLSGRYLGGGVAFLGGLCGSGGNPPYALSANLNGYFPYPIVTNSGQNWDLMVFTHETGHSFGSTHTHQYSPPIDGCGSSPQDCSVGNDGTIMSYCHQCPGGVANMRMIFHPRVENVIRNRIESIPCNYTGSGEGAVAVDDQFSVSSNFSITLPLLTNDAVLSCGAISITQLPATSQQGASLELLSNAINGFDAVLYTPPTDYLGTDSFSYTLSDSIGNSSVAEVDVIVQPTVSLLFAGGTPTEVAPGQIVQAILSSIDVELVPATARLRVGSQTLALEPVPGASNLYGAAIPSDLACPGGVELELRISAIDGTQYSSDPISVGVGFELEDFEGSTIGWVVSGSVTSTDSGIWEFGVPDGVSDRGDPANDYDGSGRCALTGAATGNTDVDDGCTILRSPRVVADQDTIVTWAQWYDNSAGASPGADVMVIEITNNLGQDWVLVDEAGPNDNTSVGGWLVQEIRVSDYLAPTNQVLMRWTVCDNGDGSVIEAGLDAFGFGTCEVVVPDPCDLNQDGLIGGPDLSILLSGWNQVGGPGDCNGDGVTNGQDLAYLLSRWTG